jgi:O-antigen/teichoic acid export membrane protein
MTAERPAGRPEPPPPRALSRDVALTYASKVMAMVAGVAMTVLVARALGPSGRGLVAIGIAITLTLVQLGTLGLVTANPYFVARDHRVTTKLITNSLWIAAGLGVILIALGAAFKAGFPGATRGLEWPETLAALAAIPFALASPFLQSLLLGQGRIIPYNTVELIQAGLVLSALAVGLFALDFGVFGVLAVLACGYLVGVITSIAFLRAHAGPPSRPDLELARATLKYGLRAYAATVLSFLVIRLDVFLVNSYLGSVEAGLYSIAAALAEGIYLLPVVVGLNLFPRVARGGSAEQTAAVFRVVAVLYGAVVLVSVPLAGPTVELLFGPDFDGAVELYYWLAPGIFFLGLLTILSNHFAGRGFPLQIVAIWIAGLSLNLLINVVFLHDGTYVASLASSVSYGVLLVAHMWLFGREIGGYRPLLPSVAEAIGFVRGFAGAVRARFG